jgi:hypothetical protein
VYIDKAKYDYMPGYKLLKNIFVFCTPNSDIRSSSDTLESHVLRVSTAKNTTNSEIYDNY